MNAAQGAGIFGAIKDAINTYMGLRQQEFQNNRMIEDDNRQREQLQLQRDQLEATKENQLFARQQSQRELDLTKQNAERDALRYVFSNFGGAPASQDIFEKANALGLDSALEQAPLATSGRPSLHATVPGSGRSAVSAALQSFQPEQPYQIRENNNDKFALQQQKFLNDQQLLHLRQTGNLQMQDVRDKAAYARALINARLQENNYQFSNDMQLWRGVQSFLDRIPAMQQQEFENSMQILNTMPQFMLINGLSNGTLQMPAPPEANPQLAPLPQNPIGTPQQRPQGASRFLPIP